MLGIRSTVIDQFRSCSLPSATLPSNCRSIDFLIQSIDVLLGSRIWTRFSSSDSDIYMNLPPLCPSCHSMPFAHSGFHLYDNCNRVGHHFVLVVGDPYNTFFSFVHIQAPDISPLSPSSPSILIERSTFSILDSRHLSFS